MEQISKNDHRKLAVQKTFRENQPIHYSLLSVAIICGPAVRSHFWSPGSFDERYNRNMCCSGIDEGSQVSGCYEFRKSRTISETWNTQYIIFVICAVVKSMKEVTCQGVMN